MIRALPAWAVLLALAGGCRAKSPRLFNIAKTHPDVAAKV